jgi:eukaryotic-like serine/threonine-protein kinase
MGDICCTALPARRPELLVLPAAAGTPPDRKPVPYLEGPYNEQLGQFSPNGRWIAYASDETGSFEVYVQSFPIGAGKFRVSTAGGSQPRWRRDGKELFYISAAARLTAVAVKTAPGFEFDAPQVLFDPQIPAGSLADGFFHYDVTADGKRILVTSVAMDKAVSAPTPITVIVNWTAALKR